MGPPPPPPRFAPLPGRCHTGSAFVPRKADSPAAAHVCCPGISHCVAGIQFWPVMKLQTAESSLAYVTQEGKPVFWILALENCPGLSAWTLSPLAFLNCLPVPRFPQESVPLRTVSPHPSIKSTVGKKHEDGARPGLRVCASRLGQVWHQRFQSEGLSLYF